MPMDWISRLLMINAISGSLCNIISATEGTDLTQATAVLTAFRASRDELRTGAFHISGTHTANDPRKLAYVGEIEGKCYFDHDRNTSRFDQLERALNGSVIGGRYVTTGDRVLSRIGKGLQASILKPLTTPPPGMAVFDVRCVGLLSWHDIKEGNVHFEDIFSAKSRLNESNVVEVFKESNSLYQIIWEDPTHTVRRSIWFDATQGWCPTRLEERYEASDRKWTEPITACDVNWINESKTWLPSAISLSYQPPSGRKNQLIYKLNWFNVNQPLEASTFSPEGMADDGEQLTVIDFRLDQPIVISDPTAPIASVLPTAGWPGRMVAYGLFGTLGLISILLLIRRFGSSAR